MRSTQQNRKPRVIPTFAVTLAAAGLLAAPAAQADAVTEWNARAGEIVVAAGFANQLAVQRFLGQ